jgi:hypothetical protein
MQTPNDLLHQLAHGSTVSPHYADQLPLTSQGRSLSSRRHLGLGVHTSKTVVLVRRLRRPLTSLRVSFSARLPPVHEIAADISGHRSYYCLF